MTTTQRKNNDTDINTGDYYTHAGVVRVDEDVSCDKSQGCELLDRQCWSCTEQCYKLTVLAEVSSEACLTVTASCLLVAQTSVLTGRTGRLALQPPESSRAV